MENLDLSLYNRIHFIGIGGVSMSALATYCIDVGKTVSGSDRCRSGLTQALSARGAVVKYGHCAKYADGADLVVYSSAVQDDNPELAAARKHGVPAVKRSVLLGCIVSGYRKSVAVAGSHGKTTVTAMITDIMVRAGKDPTAFIGGEFPPYGNYRRGESEYVVAEACEYKKNFLDIKPYTAVVLNIDDDHRDSFKGLDDETRAFSDFMKNSLAVVNADDPCARKLFNSATVCFGIDNSATYTAKRIKGENGYYSFDFYAYSAKRGRVNLKIKGRHNVYNALAALSVAEISGVPFSVSRGVLENFYGVKRRNEFIGEFNGLSCYADYAHHPTEIAALLDSYKGEEITVVFQPHTYSRTEYLIEEFLTELVKPDRTVVYKTYPAREKYSEKGSAKRLFDELKNRAGDGAAAEYADSPEKLNEILLSFVEKGAKGKILFVGAGDIYDVALALCKRRG